MYLVLLAKVRPDELLFTSATRSCSRIRLVKMVGEESAELVQLAMAELGNKETMD